MEDDYRQQQELDEEREIRTLDALRRVDQGIADHKDVEFLASELGIDPKHITKEAA